MLDLITVAAGLVLLFVGGNLLIRGAARLAGSIGIAPVTVGLTVVAFGTSVPELLVSLSAASGGITDIAVGNVVGSNVANIGLVLGLTAALWPLRAQWRLIRREIPILVGITLGVYLLALDGELSRLDGALMALGFIVFTAYSYRVALRDREEIEPEIEEYELLEGFTPAVRIDRRREAARLVLGVVLLGLGAQWTVDGATSIARGIGVSELIIGLTVVAIGTSLPELASVLVAGMRRENDIAVGSVIGSNISNLLLVLGVTAFVLPVPVAPGVLSFQMPVMIAFTAALIWFLIDRVLQRREGILLLLAYVAFVTLSFGG